MTTRKSNIVMLVQANGLQFSILYVCFVIKKYKHWAPMCLTTYREYIIV